MEKGKTEFFLKCMIFIVPFIVLTICAASFPMYYMDDEYPIWRQQRDYVDTSHENPNTILFVGDSCAKSGIIPEIVSDSSYNIAVGGTTPIEAYYSLKAYLDNNPAPETVLIAFMPVHYVEDTLFWGRTTYFHYLKKEEYSDVLRKVKELDGSSILPHNWTNMLPEFAMWSPSIYLKTAAHGLFTGRYKTNFDLYEKASEQKGQHYFGTRDSADGANIDTKLHNFNDLRIITYYMHELINLCLDNDISVIVEQMPINKISHEIIMEAYYDSYAEYLTEFERHYPDIIVQKNLFIYKNNCFGDNSHMNEKGATAYSLYLKETYFQNQELTAEYTELI